MWLQSVYNAISEVELRNPGVANRVAGFDPNSEWSEEQWSEYNLVAAAIVEPFVFPEGESEDEEFYYERCERDGFGMVKGNLDQEEWKKICDLIEIVGY
jgi:hypothetical protein